MAQGYTDAEIALFLRLSVARAGQLRARLMRQLGLQSQAELAALARTKGLVAGYHIS